MVCAVRDYQSALEASEKSLKLNPELPQAFLIKGASLQSMGKEKSAREDYNQEIKLDPGLKERAKFEDLVKSIGPCMLN